MVMNGLMVGVCDVDVRWEKKGYEGCGWMMVIGVIGLGIEYVIEMSLGLGGMEDNLGGVMKMVMYRGWLWVM